MHPLISRGLGVGTPSILLEGSVIPPAVSSSILSEDSEWAGSSILLEDFEVPGMGTTGKSLSILWEASGVPGSSILREDSEVPGIGTTGKHLSIHWEVSGIAVDVGEEKALLALSKSII